MSFVKGFWCKVSYFCTLLQSAVNGGPNENFDHFFDTNVECTPSCKRQQNKIYRKIADRRFIVYLKLMCTYIICTHGFCQFYFCRKKFVEFMKQVNTKDIKII